MKTYDRLSDDSPKLGELFRIENQQGLFTVVEYGRCSDCYFTHYSEECINAPRCLSLGAFARVDENIADNPTQVKPKRKRPSRAFKVTEPIQKGTQVSPTYRLVKQVESINELAYVFENHKSVFNLTTHQIQNTAFVQNMQFSVLLRFCKEGKIWIVEPVEKSKEYQLREKPQQETEPEATGIDTAKDLVSIVVVFGFSIVFLVMFFQTGAAIFKHEPFFYKLFGSIISLSIALYVRRKLKLNI